MALQGSSGKYLSAKPEGEVACDRDQAGDWEVFDWLSDNIDRSRETSQDKTASPPSSDSSMSSSTNSTNQELNNRFRSRTLGLRHHSEPKTIIFK